MIKIGDIPEWLLMEVLVRLPVKLVFRSKLVSKQWLSVISDPSFVRMYTSQASNSPSLQPWTFISGSMHVDGSQGWEFSNHQLLVDMYSRDIKPPSLYVLRCPSTQHPNTKRYEILGVSNGLVLYGPCIEGDRSIYIANYNIFSPITGQWITLPPYPRPFEYFSVGFLTHVENGVLTSYRVVHFCDVLFKKSSVITFKVFSSEIGEWKNFDVHLDKEIQLAWPGRPTSLNGILHWITRKHGITAYDPYDKPDFLRFIALPRDVHPRSYGATHVGMPNLCDVHQGRLRYLEMTGPYHLSSFGLWVLNNYSTGDWSLIHRINSADILYDRILLGRSLSLEPLSFHPFDSDTVYLGYENIFISYNIKSQKLEAHGSPVPVEGPILLDDTLYPCWFATFLLVVPPWPVYIPRPSFGITEDD